METASEKTPAAIAKVAGMHAWLFYSLLTVVLWGVWGLVSKIASDRIDADSNQVYFTLGLLPVAIASFGSLAAQGSGERKAGIRWAFLTGILAGAGNMAFFHALAIGGRASIVIPATALFPLVTVILATTFLRERMGTAQKIGLVLALVAIYLLSLPG
jgi:transporter family protein